MECCKRNQSYCRSSSFALKVPNFQRNQEKAAHLKSAAVTAAIAAIYFPLTPRDGGLASLNG